MVDLVVLDPFSDNGWKANIRGNNRVTETDSGSMWRIRKWPFGKRSYEIPFHLIDQERYVAIRNFFELRGFNSNGFLIWDASNFYQANQPIGTGDGATTAFQLSVTISDTAQTLTKPILNPIPTGTAIPIQYQGIPGGHTTTLHTITVAGTTKTEGTDYTISPSTGIATFAVAPPNGDAIVWTGWSYVPVLLDGQELPMELDSIYASVVPKLVELFGQ